MSTTTTTTNESSKVIAGKKAEDGMVLPLNEALGGLYDSNGNKINFQATERFAQDPSNVLPSYFAEDYETGKTYTLGFRPPTGLATLNVANMTDEQKAQHPEYAQKQQQLKQEAQQHQAKNQGQQVKEEQKEDSTKAEYAKDLGSNKDKEKSTKTTKK